MPLELNEATYENLATKYADNINNLLAILTHPSTQKENQSGLARLKLTKTLSFEKSSAYKKYKNLQETPTIIFLDIKAKSNSVSFIPFDSTFVPKHTLATLLTLSKNPKNRVLLTNIDLYGNRFLQYHQFNLAKLIRLLESHATMNELLTNKQLNRENVPLISALGAFSESDNSGLLDATLFRLLKEILSNPAVIKN